MKSRPALYPLFFLFLFVFPTSARAAEDESKLLELYSYKPLYFLMGTSFTKVELSFKTQVIRSLPVYFGYSQLMLWDLYNTSPYFYDINCNPLIWYRLNLNEGKSQWIDFIPYEHESNGRGGTLERSWNRVGIAYHQKETLTDRMRMYWDLKAWVPYKLNSNNSNLAQYRGLWEADVTLFHFLGDYFDFDDLTLRLYPGGASLMNPLRGGQELTLRLRSQYREFLPLFVFQVFHGYGEYLLDYDQDHWGVRVGVGF